MYLFKRAFIKSLYTILVVVFVGLPISLIRLGSPCEVIHL